MAMGGVLQKRPRSPTSISTTTSIAGVYRKIDTDLPSFPTLIPNPTLKMLRDVSAKLDKLVEDPPPQHQPNPPPYIEEENSPSSVSMDDDAWYTNVDFSISGLNARVSNLESGWEKEKISLSSSIEGILKKESQILQNQFVELGKTQRESFLQFVSKLQGNESQEALVRMAQEALGQAAEAARAAQQVHAQHQQQLQQSIQHEVQVQLQVMDKNVMTSLKKIDSKLSKDHRECEDGPRKKVERIGKKDDGSRFAIARKDGKNEGGI